MFDLQSGTAAQRFGCPQKTHGMIRSIHRQLACLLVACVVLQATATDVESLLDLKQLADAARLRTWAGADACGVSTCAVGDCSWERVACQQGQVTEVDLSSLGLHGSIPASWEPPAALRLLDLSNNKQLCGSLPDIKSSSPAVTIRAGGTSLGQPCTTRASVPAAGGSTAGGDEAAVGGSSMSSIAKGFLGAGVGVAGLAGAAAATMFFLHKKRSSVNESLVGHDLARVHDSVIVTKQKKRVNMTTVNKEALPGGGLIDLEAASGGESPRQRVVAFADGAGGALADEDKQRLRAANIQDSVVIIRSKLASGQLQSHHLGDEDSHGSEHSWCSDALPGSAEGSHTAPAAALDVQDCVQQPASHAAVQEGDAAQPDSAARPPHLQQSASKRVQFLGAA